MTIKFLKANHGDCVLISFESPDKKVRNILIDGGTEATYYDNANGVPGDLKNEIEVIRNHDQKIDLLILTHIDNDHVCGLIEWVRSDSSAPSMIGTVWFNSLKRVAARFNEVSTSTTGVQVKDLGNPFTGIREAIEFDDFLQKAGIGVADLIVSGETHQFFGVTIQILTPNDGQLHALLEFAKGEIKEEQDDGFTAGKSDWTTDLTVLIEAEKNGMQPFRQDPSPTNGSSITFILTLNDKRFLFLADGHPKPIVEAINKLGFSPEKPLEVVLMKLCHHGSHLNTNKELLSIVKTNRYVISTDSSTYGHPHKRTIARILNFNPAGEIMFNYGSVITAMLTSNDKEANVYKFKDNSEYKDL